MAMKQSKLFINCAVTGSIHIPTLSECLPLTPQQIAEEAIKAANAGAATILMEELSLEVATPEEGRKMLKLKGKDQTKF